VKNAKRERAKSRVVEEIKAVLEVENKIRGGVELWFNAVLQRTGQRRFNFQDCAGNVPPLNNGVTSLSSKGVRGKNKISACFKKMGSAVEANYRGAPNDRQM